MKDVLDEWLIITLIDIQPSKEEVTADYIAPSPQMAATCGNGCYGGCKTSCKDSCKGGCKGRTR